MGRQNSDPTVAGSSIALLQERFRQLQRVREKREERELLKLFSEPERSTPTMNLEPAKLSFQPEMIFPPRPTLHDSLSLGLNSQSKHADFRAIKTPPSTNLWSTDAAVMSTSQIFENSEVDTSLHL
uniref:Uncharacterized protein n=1 Tax=Davidia involucrata TaxID=16924 RepID=A0A5B7BZL8_DAVIN